MVATELGCTALLCWCTTWSGMPRPASASHWTQFASSCHIARSSGSWSQTAPTVMAWSSCSTTTATTCASDRIQRTWSAEEVG